MIAGQSPNADEVTLTHVGTALQIKDGGVGTTQLSDDGVTLAKISPQLRAFIFMGLL